MESSGNPKNNDTLQGGFPFTFPEYPGSFRKPANALFLHQCLTNTGNNTQNNEYPRQTPSIRISIDKSGNATVKKPQPAPPPMTLLNNPFKGLVLDDTLLASQNKRKCDICQKVLTKQGFQGHQKTHDKFRDRIQCICSKSFYKETIKGHLYTCHSNDIQNNPKLVQSLIYICGVCKESFVGKVDLKTHKESQHKENQHKENNT